MHTTYAAMIRFYVSTPTISLNSINGLVFEVEISLFSVRQEREFYIKFIGMTFSQALINLLAPELFFLILAHPVYKM